MRAPLCWVLLLAASGCPDRTIGKVDPDEEGEVQKDIPVSADLDLLFVIDNSASTTDKQTVFAEIHRVLRPGGRLQFADIANGQPVPEGALRDIDLWTG